MGLLNKIKDSLVAVGESIAESQERKNLRIRTWDKILQRFSLKQLKSLCERYGGGPPNLVMEPMSNKWKKIRLEASDYIDYINSEIGFDEIKDFAISNKIHISDILDEMRKEERELNEKWGAKKSQGERTDSGDDDFFKQVINAIEDFQPSRIYRDEQGYHNELQGWMKAHFRDAKVEHQTGSSRPDIVIDTRIAIEVKGPTKTSDLKTIADKCNRYLKYYDNLIVVLFEVDVNERFYNEWLNGIKDRYSEVEIIRK